ncbi:hypothetical protein GIB67_033619 [Kingdonia uniflora]|uniref:RRM domain-containing protein n=1 Tax=Kingdonia uniflora TaxID=39325 RepID=A0A7J7LAF2_9MAGN|nr:hypothetical protein GIB67_033619 [Kingdonia uniflora]
MAETSEAELQKMNIEEDLTNPTTSSDSESEDEDAQEDHLLIESLEKELLENPSNYETHIKYIKCVRKLGEIDKLRQARDSMNEHFPLSPQMWQEWAKDEASLTGNEDFGAIEKLYERGVLEYLSVPLWCDYIYYVKENDPLVRDHSQAGLSKMRDLFERALTAAGLHVVEGNKIWEAYVDFEKDVHNTIDVSDSEGREKQVQRIRSIFRRQLSVPLAESRSTLLAYKAWEVEQGGIHEDNSSDFDGIQSHVVSAHEKAMEVYKARIHHEEHISKLGASDTDRLQQFMTYLKFEQSSGDPVRVQNLFERAVTEFPVASDIWLDYTRYLDQTLKVPKVAVGVYSRAVKNCTWIGELWVRYMLSLERARGSEEVLSAVYEKSLQYAFPSFTEYLDLFLTRVDGLRRRLSQDSSTEGVLDYTLIRNTFQYAADYLSPHLKNTEEFLRLHAYWARLELKLGKDLNAARGVWESFLKNSGSMLEGWQCYIAMETEMGHTNEARFIYKRCYCKKFLGTGSEDICHAWLRFEREFGTLEDYDLAVRKVTPRMEELQLFRLQQESKSLPASVALEEEPTAKKGSQKRKMGTERTDEKTTKRQKGTPHKASEVSEKDNIISAKENDETELKARPETPNEQQTRRYSKETYTDQCTANDEHIRNFFSDAGGVTGIRLLLDKFTGKSRGLAYVDFSDDAHLTAALAKNKQILLGKRVSIARSDPKQSRKRDTSGRSTNEHGQKGPASGSGSTVDGSNSNKTSGARRKGDTNEEPVQFKGKNTFAIPRNLVRPLGYSKNEPKKKEEIEENPKSNDEFRKMLLKS